MKKLFFTAFAISMLLTAKIVMAAPPLGDTDLDGILTASDAATVMQRVLNEDAKMPIENTRSYMYIADADGDEMLTAADAALVLQKVLDSGVKFAYDGMDHTAWLERKGKVSAAQYEKEVNDAKAVFAAAQSYATDLYTQGKWQANTAVTYGRVINAGLLEDDPTYYRYTIKTTGEANTPAIACVEWNTDNSPYGKKGVYPRDAFTDELEMEWDWFNDTDYISPREIYSAALNYCTSGKAAANEKITDRDLVKNRYLSYYPKTKYDIVRDGNWIKYVEWDDGYGNKRRYPREANENYSDFDMRGDAYIIFNVSRTYATDMYIMCKWDENTKITVDDLVRSGNIKSYPIIDFDIVTSGDKNNPTISYVGYYNESGEYVKYPDDTGEYWYSGISDNGRNGASTVFSAAQTYATDLYTKGEWNKDVVITVEDLVNAGLLSQTPQINYIIHTTGESATPAIYYVEWKNDKGVTLHYPQY